MTLTRYPPASFPELWSLAFPLMISSLSVMLMVFVDRILLAHYSTEAMNAAVNASTFGWAMMASWMVLAGISEVFVAQYNGAGFREKIGEPVWQMIWVSLLSIAFFIPMAIWGGKLFYYDAIPEHQIAREYFKWMMFFGPAYPFYSALCGFFVGRGKTVLITVLAICANFVNGLLDWLLIFGWKDIIPSLGPTGAAIATSGSLIFQVAVLFYFFLKKKNRTDFGTGRYAIHLPALSQCLKIGFPGALFVGLEIFGFAVYFWLMTKVGESYITIAGICQSVVILFYFFADGVNKAATAVAGNLLGSKRTDLMNNVFSAGLKMHVLFFFFLLCLFYFFSDDLVMQFLPDASEEKIANINNSLSLGLLCMVFYMFFEGVRLLLIGILTAAGDTLFLSIAGILTVWLLFVLPVYLIIVVGHAPEIVGPLLCIFYSAVASGIYFRRYLSDKWLTVANKRFSHSLHLLSE